MSITRNSIPFGPAKIVQDETSWYSAGDVNIDVITEWSDVNSDQYGQGVKTVLDQRIEVSFRPQSLWSLLSTVYPSTHINPTIGNRIIGASPTNLVLHGEDSSLLTIFAPALVQIPSIMLGVDKGEFGEMKFIGVVTNDKSPGEASSLYTYAATGGTYGTPSDPDYLAAAQWDATWNTDDLAGTLLEAVTINPDFKAEPVKAGPRTVDYRFAGTQFSAGLILAADLADLSDIYNDGSTFVYGGRNTTIGQSLVLTSALGHTFTLAAATPERHAMAFSMKIARNRAIAFRTSGLTGARISWTTPS